MKISNLSIIRLKLLGKSEARGANGILRNTKTLALLKGVSNFYI